MGRLMTQEDVADLLEEFQRHLASEQKLQEELVSLQVHGSRERVARARERHDEIIEEIDRIRNGAMMPIVEKLASFVSVCQELERREGG